MHVKSSCKHFISFSNFPFFDFLEEEAGLLQKHELPHAEDLKNFRCDEDCHSIYYGILGETNCHFYFNIMPIVCKLCMFIAQINDNFYANGQ